MSAQCLPLRGLEPCAGLMFVFVVRLTRPLKNIASSGTAMAASSRTPVVIAAAAIATAAASTSAGPASPPSSWPDAPFARAYWPELGGLPLWAPPPLALPPMQPGRALAVAPDFTYASLGLVVGLEIGAASPAAPAAAAVGGVTTAWTTPAVVPNYASADYWPTMAAPRALLLAAGGSIAVTGATLRSVPQPSHRRRMGMITGRQTNKQINKHTHTNKTNNQTTQTNKTNTQTDKQQKQKTKKQFTGVLV